MAASRVYNHGPQHEKKRFRFEFSSGDGSDQQYRDNWDRIFGKKKGCPNCGSESWSGPDCETCKRDAQLEEPAQQPPHEHCILCCEEDHFPCCNDGCPTGRDD